MSTDGVLASIDACLEDYLSDDAMRWAPDEPDPTPQTTTHRVPAVLRFVPVVADPAAPTVAELNGPDVVDLTGVVGYVGSEGLPGWGWPRLPASADNLYWAPTSYRMGGATHAGCLTFTTTDEEHYTVQDGTFDAADVPTIGTGNSYERARARGWRPRVTFIGDCTITPSGYRLLYCRRHPRLSAMRSAYHHRRRNRR